MWKSDNFFCSLDLSVNFDDGNLGQSDSGLETCRSPDVTMSEIPSKTLPPKTSETVWLI